MGNLSTDLERRVCRARIPLARKSGAYGPVGQDQLPAIDSAVASIAAGSSSPVSA
jgi:hypothetical protein